MTEERLHAPLAVDWSDLSVAVRRVGPPLLLLSGLLVAWQAVVLATDVPPVVLPSPLAVADALVASAPALLSAAAVTAVTAGVGLAGGVLVGLGLAFAMTASRTASAVVHPYVVALRIAPVVAIAPLVFLWFGHGVPARALLVATMTVFPVAIASLDGLRSVPREQLDLARSVAASPLRTFFAVRVPAAAPSVFAGVKLAAALSVVGAVTAEFLTLTSGLGYRVFDASTRLRTAAMFAALLALACLGVGFYLLPTLVERRLDWTAGD